MKLLFNPDTGKLRSIVGDSVPANGLVEVFVPQSPVAESRVFDVRTGETQIIPADLSAVNLSSLTAEQIAYHVRKKRDMLLAECDYLALPDYPLTSAQRAEWALYRQALRDMPATPDLSLATAWPTKPQ